MNDRHFGKEARVGQFIAPAGEHQIRPGFEFLTGAGIAVFHILCELNKGSADGGEALRVFRMNRDVSGFIKAQGEGSGARRQATQAQVETGGTGGTQFGKRAPSDLLDGAGSSARMMPSAVRRGPPLS